MTLDSDVSKNISRLFLLSSIFVLLIIFSLISRVTPWADEWQMVLLEPMSFPEWLRWLFAPHNDHVILFQKLLQSVVIKASGYDFRSLVLLNIAAIVGSAWAMLRLAEEFRGKSSLFDITIVLALCSVGPNAVTWSSTFAFPATNFIIAAFSLIWMRAIVTGVSGSLAIAATLLLCAGPFIAAGGAVATTVLCICLWFLKLNRKDVPLPLPLVGLVVATVINAAAWVMFRPSAASGIEIERIPSFIVGLAGSSIYWWNLPGESLKNIVCTIFILAAVLYSTLLFLRKQPHSKSIVVASNMIAVFTVMLSIAIGRSAYTEWFSRLKVHYGITTALLIPLGLLMFEGKFRLMRWVSGAFMLLFAVSYVLAFRYEAALLKSVRPANFAAIQRLAHSTDLAIDLVDHWTDYWWRKEDTEMAPALAQHVKFIREQGATLYQPWKK